MRRGDKDKVQNETRLRRAAGGGHVPGWCVVTSQGLRGHVSLLGVGRGGLPACRQVPRGAARLTLHRQYIEPLVLGRQCTAVSVFAV
eukprot:1633927-Rhodomonas_salina.4